jgi:hypothetical protein
MKQLLFITGNITLSQFIFSGLQKFPYISDMFYSTLNSQLPMVMEGRSIQISGNAH